MLESKYLERKAMKFVRVTSISPYGENTISHPVSEFIPEDMITLAVLRGVINAGNAIKSFEIVEA